MKNVARSTLLLISLMAGLSQLTYAQDPFCVLLESQSPPEAEGIEPAEVRYIRIAAHVVRYSDGTGGITLTNLYQSIVDLNTAFDAAVCHRAHRHHKQQLLPAANRK